MEMSNGFSDLMEMHLGIKKFIHINTILELNKQFLKWDRCRDLNPLHILSPLLFPTCYN